MNKNDKISHILLDCDGVLADFFSSALSILNRDYSKNITVEKYIEEGLFDMEKVFDISVRDFWKSISNEPNFWLNLRPFPWSKKLLSNLRQIAPVIISTSPEDRPECYKQKAQWLKTNLGLGPKDIMIGSRKYLMARPDHVLIDDYEVNTCKFIAHGGKSILVPSNWNTLDLTYDMVWSTIKDSIDNF